MSTQDDPLCYCLPVNVRVAVVQIGSTRLMPGDPTAPLGATSERLFNTVLDLERAMYRIEQAARDGAELVVFPEAYLGGYPKGLDFGTRVGSRSPEGRQDFRRYATSAIEVPGDETAVLSETAAHWGIHLVMGCVERAGGTLYCTVLFFGPDGTLLGKHRKVMPTAMERLIWGFGDGSALPVLETGVGRVGAVICWENYMPLLRTAMYQKGIELYCACTVDDRESWVPTMRHIAFEGRCFVLSACQFVEGQIRGGSLIADPFGQIIAGPVYGEEAVLTADIDLGRIAEGKFDLDVVGHYARPDIFQLEVNEGRAALPPEHATRAAVAHRQEMGSVE
jgi:nitrilase